MSTSLMISREERLLRVTLNRPKKRNALSFELCGLLVGAMEEAERDRRVGAILLGAAGSAFCAGMDLTEAHLPQAAAQAEIHERMFTIGARIRKPVVAAVQGPALGGGLGLVANAHIVVAAQKSTFGLTEIRIGLWPLVVYRSMKLAVGERRALELSLTGRIFGAKEALAWGLVHHIAPAAELNDRATEIAAALASSSVEAVQSGLEFVHQSRGLDWTRAGKLAARYRARAFESRDFGEGVNAFREKRTPRWPSLEPDAEPGQ
jgi:enoyl-CoA hydratase/carnithine racemase